MGLLEKRIIIYTALVLMFVMTFGILRLYNALVQNTRFSIKLKQELTRFESLIMDTQRKVKSARDSIKETATTYTRHAKIIYEGVKKEFEDFKRDIKK